MRRSVLGSLLAAAVVALLWSAIAIAMYAAWDHNPQHIFHDAMGINWSEWLTIGAMNFAAAFVIAASTAIVVLFSALLMRGAVRL
jgi:hypothetical protein